MVSPLNKIEIKNIHFFKERNGNVDFNKTKRIKCYTWKQISHPLNANKSHTFQINQ